MTKEQETLEKLLSFAFVMGENMVGLTKGNYDEDAFIKKTYAYLHKYSVDLHSRLELKQALQRLESIDNTDTSEVLERVSSEFIDGYPTGNVNVGMTWEEYSAIKEALQKTQEFKRTLNIIWEKPAQSKATIVYIKATINPTYEDYCLVIRDEYHLTEEEFDLLNGISKDILLNEVLKDIGGE